MRKWFVLASQTVLLSGAVSFGTMSLSSCSIEVWKSNIQLVCSPGGSKLADHSFQQNSFDGILDFLKSVRYKDQPFVEPKPENNIDKLGGLWRHPISFDGMQFMETYRDAYASGAKVLVCTGFEQKTPLEQFTSADPKVVAQFPDWATRLKNNLGIVYVDGGIETGEKHFNSQPFNVSSVSFAADQAGVMAGILTGINLNIDSYYEPHDVDFSSSTYSKIKVGGNDKTKDIKTAYTDHQWYNGKAFKIGGYVGLPGQSTLTFLNGWFQGANYFNNNWKTLQTLTEEVIEEQSNHTEKLATNGKQWYPLTTVGPAAVSLSELTMDGFTAGSFSPVEPRAKTLVNDYMNQGVSAFLPVAGPQDALVVGQVAQAKKHMAIIGTDVALEDDDSANQYLGTHDLPQSIIPFSIKKNLWGSVSSILKAADKAMSTGQTDVDDNKYYGFGYNNWGVWDNEGVQVSHGKICYDTTTGKKYSDKICTAIVKKISDSMKIAKSTPYVLNGREMDKTTIAEYEVESGNGKSEKKYVVTVPWIRSSVPKTSKDGPNNIYPVPDLSKGLDTIVPTDAFRTKIADFVKNLSQAIGTVKVGGEDRRNWYMYRV